MATTIAVVAVLTKLWTWPNAVVGGLLMLCSLLYLMDKIGLGPTPRMRIRNWLDDSGFGIQTVNDENAIHFVLVDNVGLYTHIMQVKHGDPINIGMPKLKPDGKQIAAFNALNDEEQQAIWKPIRLELLRNRIQYSDLNVTDGVLISFQIGMARTLTGVEFLREVTHVRTAGRLYLELLNEHFPKPKQSVVAVAATAVKQ